MEGDAEVEVVKYDINWQDNRLILIEVQKFKAKGRKTFTF